MEFVPHNFTLVCSSYPSINGHVNGVFTLPEDLADMGVPFLSAACISSSDFCTGIAHRLARAFSLLWNSHPHWGGGSAIFYKFWAAMVQVNHGFCAADHVQTHHAFAA